MRVDQGAPEWKGVSGFVGICEHKHQICNVQARMALRDLLFRVKQGVIIISPWKVTLLPIR